MSTGLASAVGTVIGLGLYVHLQTSGVPIWLAGLCCMLSGAGVSALFIATAKRLKG